jgi:hypothetical protein
MWTSLVNAISGFLQRSGKMVEGGGPSLSRLWLANYVH